MSETATQAIVKNATKSFTVIDTLGRKLDCVTLTALQRMNLVAAAGRDLSLNTAWMEFAWPTAMVQSIDGVPLPTPQNRRGIEANVTALGSEGIEAVVMHFMVEAAAQMNEAGTEDQPAE